jgi:hypothetical protein
MRLVGIIAPERLYTADALRRVAGLGPEKTAEMRKAGVKSFPLGNCRWYRGADVIRWIKERGHEKG